MTNASGVLAADFGGTHVSCAAIVNGRIVQMETVPVSDRRSLGALLPDLAGVLRRLRATLASCSGLGVSFCGVVDPHCGAVLSTPQGKYDDARSLDLPSWCLEHIGVPMRIENDARMALLGERYAGAARGCDDVVMVTLGTGVGGAAMIDGHLLRGRHFQAGCMGGHLPARWNGRACICGAIGCVEAEASGWVLPEICREWPGIRESALTAEPEVNFAVLFRHARTGDRVASEIVNHCAGVWSAGLVGLIHAYDPDMIVVGGAVMGGAELILPALQDRVKNHSWTPWGTVRVVAAELGNHAALLGAVPLLEGGC